MCLLEADEEEGAISEEEAEEIEHDEALYLDRFPDPFK
jgi:hypothetical protein